MSYQRRLLTPFKDKKPQLNFTIHGYRQSVLLVVNGATTSNRVLRTEENKEKCRENLWREKKIQTQGRKIK